MDKDSLNLEIISTDTPSQDWARIVNENFSKIDYHNHTIYNGAPILSSNLVGGTLDVNNNKILNIDYISFNVNTSWDVRSSLFADDVGNLSYINDDVHLVKITNGGSLNLVNVPEGYTTPGAIPVSTYIPASNHILMYDEFGLNVAKVTTHEAHVTDIKSTTLVADNLVEETVISIDTKRNRVLGVQAPNVSLALSTTYKAFETRDLYKVSETGAFYYDDKPLASAPTAVTYDLSYFKGAKNYVFSPNGQKSQKTGKGYEFSKKDFVTSNNVNETFTVIESLGTNKIVSICPIFETTGPTLEEPAFSEGLFEMPVFKFLINEDSVQVFASYNLPSNLFNTVTLSFKIILVDEDITFGDGNG